MTSLRGTCLACLVLFSALVSAQLDTSCVANSGAVLSTSSSGSWNADREVFNEKVDVQPAGVAYAYTAQQVQALVQCGRANGVKVVPRGGGHGYEGYAVQTGALTVDVSNLTSFQIDPTRTYATFGTGFRLGQLFLRMYLDANSLFPAGLCPWVGTAGHILGGGTGLNSRSYGLACDQVVALSMVNYQGQLITANSTHNSDLLWASCGGGGGNLGIVTSYTVKLNSLSTLPKVTTIEIGWSSYDNAVQLFDKVQRWAPYADRRMSVQILIGFGGVSLNAQWQGDKASAQAELDKSGVLSVPGTWRNDIIERSWINATLLWGANTMGTPQNSIYDLNMTDGVPPGTRNYFQAASSYNQQLMSTAGIQTMVNAISSLGSGATAYAEHKMLLGAVSDVPKNGSAFFWRDSLFETQWMYAWSSGNQAAAASNWLNQTLTAMQPYIGQGAYINYPDPLLAARSDWPQRYYGDNLDRYVAVKTEYDPTDYFSNPLTVMPSSAAVASDRPEVIVGDGVASPPPPPPVSTIARASPPQLAVDAPAPAPRRALTVPPARAPVPAPAITNTGQTITSSQTLPLISPSAFAG